MKRVLQILLLTSLLCLTFSARGIADFSTAAKDNWTSVHSRNFLLLGNAEEKELRRTVEKFEQFRAVIARLFIRPALNEQTPIRVIVFKNQAAYRPFMPVWQGKTNEVAGYFLSGQDVHYISLPADFRGKNPYAIVFHEYVHALNHDNIGKIPAWLNEGLAEFYSSFEISDDGLKVTLGKPLAHHVALLRGRQFAPLASLFAVDQHSADYNEQEKRGSFYAQSWALVHYLMLGDTPAKNAGNNTRGVGTRYPQLLKYLQLLSTGAPAEESFRQAFQTDAATLEQELTRYLSQENWPVQKLTFDQRLTFDATLQAAPMTEAETQSYLGDLLAQAKRPEAESYLQRALALDPNLALANYSTAMLRLRQERFAEAGQHFQRALAAANSEKLTSHLAHFYYAYTLSREDAGHQQARPYPAEKIKLMRAELRKAIALKPDHAESYSLLAHLNLTNEEQLDETPALLRSAVALAPARQDFVIQLGHAYLKLQQFAAARRVLEPLTVSNNDPPLREQAQSLLASIESQEQMAEYNAARKAAAEAGPETTSSSTDWSGEDVRLPLPFNPPVLRRRFKENKIAGLLTELDCADTGITLIVKAGTRTYRFRSGAYEQISFTSRSNSAVERINCGPLSHPAPVIITFRAFAEAVPLLDGEPVEVEFIPPQ